MSSAFFRSSPGGAAAMEAVGSYILLVADTPAEWLGAALRDLAGPEAGESIMSTGENLIAEGLAKGMAKGKAETLLRLLRRRFGNLPPALEHRVQSASIAELDRWADRILDAATLESVFASE
jgi:hypothetical protein